MSLRLSDVTGLLDTWYDPAWAEAWDAVGLVCGDPEQPVSKVLLAVDPAPEVVAEALAWGADLVVCHHPLLLSGVHGVAATTPKGRVVHDLVRGGVALLTAHTNADVPADGVNESLARAVGIVDPQVVVGSGGAGLDKLVVFVPHEHADAVRRAVTAAGAGAIGDYDSASFTSEGEGRFRPLDGAAPAIGTVGELEVVPESRIEAVLPRSRRREVVAGDEIGAPLRGTGLRRLRARGRPRRRRTLPGARPDRSPGVPDHAARVRRPGGRRPPATAHGVRVAGDPDRPVETVVVGSGSGDFMLDTVLGTDADVYLTSDLRHHRAGEFLEHDGPALVDVAHWAAEWTWLPVVERKLLAAVREQEATVETRVSRTVTDPWTFRVDRPRDTPPADDLRSTH